MEDFEDYVKAVIERQETQSQLMNIQMAEAVDMNEMLRYYAARVILAGEDPQVPVKYSDLLNMAERIKRTG